MIIPMNNGKTIIPIYIPEPVVTANSGVLQQSNNAQNSEPTLATWIVLGVFLILLITLVVCFIKLIKDFWR